MFKSEKKQESTYCANVKKHKKMLDSDSTLKYFSSLPLQTHQIKLSNTSKEIIYLSNLSQINTQEEDPSNLPLRIHYITEAKFYELVTSYEYQDTEIFNTLLYGYYFFTDEQKLFRNLIERFRLVNPLNLSKNEGLFFQRKLLKTIQIKVEIFDFVLNFLIFHLRF